MHIAEPSPELLLESAMFKISVQRTINASTDRVWRRLSAVEGWAGWRDDVSEIHLIDDSTNQYLIRDWMFKSHVTIAKYNDQHRLVSAIDQFNVPGLLNEFVEELSCTQGPNGPESTVATINFAFNPGWLMWATAVFSLTNMYGTLYFDARSSLKKLDQLVTSTSLSQ